MHPADITLTPDHDLALVAPLPDDPEVIETFNIWLYDGARNTGINLHPRATGGAMESAITVFLPDGRIARANHGAPGPFTDPRRPSSAVVKLFCEKPFERWQVVVDDAQVYMTSDADQAARTSDDTPTTRISMEASFTMVAPAWINGALLPESRQTLQDQVSWWFGNRIAAGFSPLAYRYDQLIEGSGTIHFEGRDYPFEGVGLRGHVRGVRRMPGMLGHTWAEGYCPETKRGFGSTMFLRKGGGYVHSEGFLFEDGVLHPARVICTPHIERDPRVTGSVFELACDALGLRRIVAEDLRTFWWQLPSWGEHGAVRFGWNPEAPVLMRQGIARFTWEDGGDTGYGLIERSG
jgi:hypothetical protein